MSFTLEIHGQLVNRNRERSNLEKTVFLFSGIVKAVTEMHETEITAMVDSDRIFLVQSGEVLLKHNSSSK